MKLSIIIVTYKNNDDLINTLDSISNSLNLEIIHEVEIIIIDGASENSVFTIISSFKHLPIKLVSENDDGIYDGMNKGVLLAKGRHTIFMNSGDLFNNSVLNNFLKIDRDDTYLYYGDSDFYNGKNFSFNFKTNMKTKKQFLRHNCFSHQAIFYPTNLIKSLGGYNLDYTISADFDLTWRCYISGCNFVHLNTVIAKCSLGGISCKKGLTSYKDRCKSFNHSKHYLYAIILYAYYPIFFIKNRLVMLLEGSSILNLYRKIKNKSKCQN